MDDEWWVDSGSDIEGEDEEVGEEVAAELEEIIQLSDVETIDETIDDECSEGASDDAFDMALNYEKYAQPHEHLKADVKMAARDFPYLERDLCIPSVQIENADNPSYEGICSVALTLNMTKLPEMIRRGWQVPTAMTVSVIVDGIHKRDFRTFPNRPTLLARIDCERPSKFIVGECLINAVKPLVTNTFSLPVHQHPDEAGSFFSLLYEQLVERLNTLTEFCMVCGEKLYAGGRLPSICYGQLCQYQYQELGLYDGLSTPRVSGPILSLLLMAFNAAATSPRWNDILTPAPSARDKDSLVADVKQLYRKIEKKWTFVESEFDLGGDVHTQLGCAMPCARAILDTPASYWEFKKAYPSVAEFVEWLVISNQSYLEVVPTALKVDYFQACEQFIFVADSPAKQAEFDCLVKENGGKTRYLFHGSRAENWHSIIRAGLKNMSGTKWQLVGAAYGNGIYLSNHLPTSFTYCVPFEAGSISENCLENGCCMPSIKTSPLSLLAVVEVVDTPTAYQHNGGGIVVVKEDKWCSIRMLVAYSGTKAAVPNIDLDKMTPEGRKKVRNVVHMFKTADINERAKHI